MKNCHESEQLNALLGKQVKITFFDDSTQTGELKRGEFRNRYRVNYTEFYKSHIKKISEVN